MLELAPPPTTRSSRQLLRGLLTAGVALLCLWVLTPFVASIAWAAILAYVSWPAYRPLRKLLDRSATAAALLMTLLITCGALIPILWLLFLLRNELTGSFKPIVSSLSQGAHIITDGAGRIPWLGPLLQRELDRYLADPSAFGREAVSFLQTWVGALASLLGGLGRSVAKLLLALVILFFFYRDGDAIAHELARAAKKVYGDGYARYARAAGAITRAIFFGLIVSAMAQGVIAGIGYRIAGLTAPALLGALTGVLSVIPLLGTALVWLPIAIGLMVTGAWGKGLFLLAWGMVLVHPTDNLLRPLLVSNASRLPFLLVALGVIGGMTAFGLIGAFAGPLLFGLATEFWRERAATLGR